MRWILRPLAAWPRCSRSPRSWRVICRLGGRPRSIQPRRSGLNRGMRMTIPALFDSLGRDMRYATRMLRHNPMFTCVALLTLAIGIGANSAVFSVVNSVLLRPLSYPHADELVAVRHNAPGAAGLSVAS